MKSITKKINFWLVPFIISIGALSCSSPDPVNIEPIKDDIIDIQTQEPFPIDQIQNMSDFEAFINTNVFANLHNLNNGFTDEYVQLYSKKDSKTAFEIIRDYTIGVTAIRSWKNQQPYNFTIFEWTGSKPTDSIWYMEIEEFIDLNEHEDAIFEFRIAMPDSLLIG